MLWQPFSARASQKSPGFVAQHRLFGAGGYRKLKPMPAQKGISGSKPYAHLTQTILCFIQGNTGQVKFPQSIWQRGALQVNRW